MKHVERTGLLLHIVDVSSGDLNVIQRDIDIIENELKSYGEQVYQKPRWLILNKLDMLDETVIQQLETLSKAKQPTRYISALTGLGLKNLCYDIYNSLSG